MNISIASIIPQDYKGRRILKWNSFAELSEESTWNSILESDVLNVDLQELDIIGQDGMIWVMAIILYRTSKNLNTSIVLPASDNLNSFLKLIRLHELSGELLKFNFENDWRYHLSPPKYSVSDMYTQEFLPIRLIHQGNWDTLNNKTLGKVGDFLQDRLNLSPIGEINAELLKPFIITLQELVHNVAKHASIIQGMGKGLLTISHLPISLNRLMYCVSDVGPGFKTTINASPEREGEKPIDSDLEAAIMALLFRQLYPVEKVFGLYNTLLFIRMQKGILNIRAGCILLRLDLSKNGPDFDDALRNANPGWIQDQAKILSRPWIPGVHVSVELQLPPKGDQHARR